VRHPISWRLVYTAPAGSPDADALALLGAIGLQSFSLPALPRQPARNSRRVATPPEVPGDGGVTKLLLADLTFGQAGTS
jgi:hypothetical protein